MTIEMEVLPCPVSVDFSTFGGDAWSSSEYDLADSLAAEARDALCRRLEAELRAAHPGAVVLPPELLPAVAQQVLSMADIEPCGLRGCTLHVDVETGRQPEDRIRITTVKCAPDTVSTFELYLTLRQDSASWRAILPQFLKNLASGGTLMLSREFTLRKKRLFRSFAE